MSLRKFTWTLCNSLFFFMIKLFKLIILNVFFYNSYIICRLNTISFKKWTNKSHIKLNFWWFFFHYMKYHPGVYFCHCYHKKGYHIIISCIFRTDDFSSFWVLACNNLLVSFISSSKSTMRDFFVLTYLCKSSWVECLTWDTIQ